MTTNRTSKPRRRKAAPSVRTYEVTVADFPPVVYSAVSPAKARAEAWRSFSECRDCKFKEFLRISRVRACQPPDEDGYDYVRRNYDVDPKIGGRVRLVNEGPSTGLEGTVAYPGSSTAYVHVILDGRDHVSHVHPSNIVII